MSKEQTPITAEKKKRVAKEMSKRDWKDKEQTPITAEEFLDAKGFLMDDFRSEQRYLLIRDLMEQYAQAQVLKALKRDNKINRVEVIDEKGRSYVKYCKQGEVELSFQDKQQTLKVFITKQK